MRFFHCTAARGWLLSLTASVSSAAAQAPRPDTIPLPEHPRPDFQRAEWLNLNGRWSFAFDARDAGIRAGWPNVKLPPGHEILVPFSWGAALSGVPDSAAMGWYARSITVPNGWHGRRAFPGFASRDWRTTALPDGQKPGEHQGAATPLSVEPPRGA